MVELETIPLHSCAKLTEAYRLARALDAVGIPSYLQARDGTPLPPLDEGELDERHAPAGPWQVSIYPQDRPLALDIVAETFPA